MLSPQPSIAESGDLAQIRRLWPYFWPHRFRVGLALLCMVAAKSANIGVPLLLKAVVDGMNVTPTQAVVVVPAALIVAYAALRLSSTLFNELREWVMSRATEFAARKVGLDVFAHLHALDLKFHLARQTGGMSRDIERGIRSVQSLVSYAMFSIVPTLLEVGVVLAILAFKFDLAFAWVTATALALYITFTVLVTEWRTQFRKRMNELDTKAHASAIDSLLNFETVKYFNNEAFEVKRYDERLQSYQQAAQTSQNSLSALNLGQQLIIASALVGMLWLAANGVAKGSMSLGDLVMVNAFMIQLYIPLNFLGVMYREIKQGVTDLRRMFTLLDTRADVEDTPTATDWVPNAAPTVGFESVDFGYGPERKVLSGVSFEIPAGKTVAVVGPSGCGKSTLVRLLYRLYDCSSGQITVDGTPVGKLKAAAVQRAIGVVPQDTVLFNDTLGYNIAYGRMGATESEVKHAARAAQLDTFIAGLPLGYDTPVGERGLKLSGGEKQRVAIARTLLKAPWIYAFDEATSALDSPNERAIQAQLAALSGGRTTLVVAHRLSTVTDAHEILVMDQGQIIERGSHTALLAQNGRYASMWALQQENVAESANTADLAK